MPVIINPYRVQLSLLRAPDAPNGLFDVLAVVQGRDYAMPDDVKYLAQHCFPHRLTIKGYSALGKTETQEKIIAEIIDRVPVPTEQIEDDMVG